VKLTQRQSNWKIPFFTIWTGQAFSLVGSMLVQFALIWWLTESTGSATVLATATLVGLLPAVFVGPFAGALVDRWNRRVVMIVADAIIALATIWLATLFALDAVRVWHVYAIMFIRAVAGGFHWPAMEASTSLMVPEEHLSRVAGMNQALHGALNIVSPPLGALLLGVLSLQAILMIDVGTAVLAVVPLFFVHIPQPQSRPASAAADAAKSSLWRDVRQGLRYVWGWPGLFAFLLMFTIGNFLFSPAFSLLPLLVTGHFGGKAFHLGWLEAAAGIGVLLGGLVLSAWGGFRRRILTSLMGFVGIGVGILTVGLAPASAFWLALGATFLVGLSIAMTDGPIVAVVQAKVAPEMQGRVFTLMHSASKAMSPLSLAVAGPVADLLGVRVWYVVGGVICVLLGVSAFFVPVIVHLEDDHDEPAVLGGEKIAAAPAPVPLAE
jgi:DHA3 family macrolide efflux protein-like MFS transporter